MRVVAAPDSFKGSIAAAAAAAALAAGWRLERPGDEVIELPLADGGEGTLAVLAAAVPASRWHSADVCGPGTARVSAAWLEIPGNGAVIELAAAAGLPLLTELIPLDAHSYGVGELIAHALAAGARRDRGRPRRLGVHRRRDRRTDRARGAVPRRATAAISRVAAARSGGSPRST